MDSIELYRINTIRNRLRIVGITQAGNELYLDHFIPTNPIQKPTNDASI